MEITPAVAAQYKNLKSFLWDELLMDPQYDQHTEVNRPKFKANMRKRMNLKRCAPEFLPLKALPDGAGYLILDAVIDQVCDEFDAPDPEVLKD